ncbi:uncharacterized protein LOC105426837 [Pogonomyrmex barbatus]|uniref:Uncharacterized protein LOC105426837 n=1 Tax=Pogonomyrmex barbatus TaxID=144034 RepID=A0A6I9W523_9HYME|nr:uncharacterized protein LOC105426837 [Pogonomyrmex barbatus]
MSAQELRRQRGYIKAKQIHIWKFVENVANQRTSPSIETVTIYSKRLEQVYKEFNEIQRQLVCVIEENELPIEDQREDDVFEERYVELSATLSRWAAAIKSIISTTNGGESLAQVIEQQTEVIRALSSNGSQIDTTVKLPVINLPIFSGEIEDWTRFSDTFTALIHNNDLSAIQKLQYLIGALTGSAAKIIESIEISAQNYEVAWNLLKNSYEDKKVLKRRHLQCLFEAPKVERESAVDIQELINHFQKHLRIVKSISETWADSLILYMVEEKLNRVTRRRWEERKESRQNVTVDLLFDFLQRRMQMLDRLGSAFHREESN